jgi:hypothetical protein
MRWEELTGDEFPLAVTKADGVCLLPLSCIERHARWLSEEALKRLREAGVG